MTEWSKGNWLVTGASAGFGLEIVKAVLARGGKVAAASRDPSKLAALAAEYPDHLLPVAMDVGDKASIRAGAAQVIEAFGAVDVLVNNAGYTMLGAVEEISEEEYRPLIEVNFFGVVELTKLLLPAMRARHKGFVVTFSSVSGVVGAPGSGYYAAAKFAVEGWTDALRAEGKPLGIEAMIVEPGPFRTEFFGAKRLMSKLQIDEYANVASRRTNPTEQLGAQPGDPARGAAIILEVMESGRAPGRLPLGPLAVDVIGGVYKRKIAEIEEWAPLTRTADFPDAEPRVYDQVR